MTTTLAVIKSEKIHSSLATLDGARLALANARTLPEVKKIRDTAEAAKVYAKAAHLGREAQNYAAEIAILAACKAGEIFERLDKSKGGRPKTGASVAGVSEYAAALKDSDTPPRTAQGWQMLARIPEAKRTEYFKTVHASNLPLEISTSGLRKAATGVNHTEKRIWRSKPVDDFEDLRKLAMEMLNLGHKERRKSSLPKKLDGSHLAAALAWARCRIQETAVQVPVIRISGEVVSSTDYSAADATETASKFIENLVQRLSAADKAIVHRSLLTRLQTLLGDA